MLATPTFLAGAIDRLPVFFPTFPDEFACYAGDRAYLQGWRLGPAPCIVGVRRLPLVYTGALYGVGCLVLKQCKLCVIMVGVAVVLLLQQQPPASNIPPECAHYLSMQPYRFDLSRRPVLSRHAIISCELSRCVTSTEILRALPWRDPAFPVYATTALYFYFISRDGKFFDGGVLSSITLRSIARHGDCFREGPPIRYVSTLDEADLKPWPLVIDHRVTVPLPNFKYAHTSQLVTTNYLGRLLALEEAI
ncbi:hypothetical protein ALC56_06744 [Trachymyrmex septentrionalis]|uniref:Uncharacterized protein n=1 Tax=Trachymyrmex septentrionalis TaxID=34720 RepID=A0A195FDK7_9HYME|nr:hypothetical protein ALC56_06744 [Trachymyrmex septentrionalis]